MAQSEGRQNDVTRGLSTLKVRRNSEGTVNADKYEHGKRNKGVWESKLWPKRSCFTGDVTYEQALAGT